MSTRVPSAANPWTSEATALAAAGSCGRGRGRRVQDRISNECEIAGAGKAAASAAAARMAYLGVWRATQRSGTRPHPRAKEITLL